MMNKHNLYKHALFLLERDKQLKGERFDMLKFSNGTINLAFDYSGRRTCDREEACGTVACSLGEAVLWAPDGVIDEALHVYINITEPVSFFSLLGDMLFNVYDFDIWCYLFASYWRYHDNTRKGAAKRILYHLSGHPFLGSGCTKYKAICTGELILEAKAALSNS